MFWLPSARGQHADKDAAQSSNRDCFPWAFVDKVVSGMGHHAIFCANHIPGFGERFFAAVAVVFRAGVNALALPSDPVTDGCASTGRHRCHFLRQLAQWSPCRSPSLPRCAQASVFLAALRLRTFRYS